jgi:ABC-2 type transport system permease protein
MSFVNAVRAEFAKLITVRMWWVMLLILVGYVGFISALLALVFGALGDQLAASGGDVPQIPPHQLPLLIYSNATSIGYVFPVLFGALATTAEFRYQTLTPTFLANPRRGQVLGAKFLTMAIVGALFGVAALLASVGIGGATLAATGSDPEFGATDTWSLIGRAIIAMALWAVIGVGLGTLIPNQVAAIVVVLVFTQFVEPLLRLGASIWDWTAQVGKFLPGAASDALVGTSIFTSLGSGTGTATTAVVALDWWQGGLVLLAIAVLAAIGGYFTSWRKDVT